MKKILLGILLSVVCLSAGTPIHDKTDSRILGKSFGGQLDDNVANKDGLGVVSLQYSNGSTEINNELRNQKVLKKLVDKYGEDAKKAEKSIIDQILTGTNSVQPTQQEIDFVNKLKTNNPSSPTITLNNINIQVLSLAGTGHYVAYRFNIYDKDGIIIPYSNMNVSSIKSINTRYPENGTGIYSIGAGLGSYLEPPSSGADNKWYAIINNKINLEIKFNTPLDVSKIEFIGGPEFGCPNASSNYHGGGSLDISVNNGRHITIIKDPSSCDLVKTSIPLN